MGDSNELRAEAILRHYISQILFKYDGDEVMLILVRNEMSLQ
jgi:hypothetical protein